MPVVFTHVKEYLDVFAPMVVEETLAGYRQGVELMDRSRSGRGAGAGAGAGAEDATSKSAAANFAEVTLGRESRSAPADLLVVPCFAFKERGKPRPRTCRW